MLVLLKLLSLAIVDYNKLSVCIHEAAHLVIAQELNIPVSYIVLEETFRGWEGRTVFKGRLKDSYQTACISYAGFFIESQFNSTALFSSLEYTGDRESVGNHNLDTIFKDLELLVFSEEVQEYLVYISILLYYQDRVFMKAPSHYDAEFAAWDF